MTDDVLTRLGDLRDELDRALSRFDSAAGAVGPTSGTDESGAVTVKLDKDGNLRSVGVAADWTSRVSPAELGQAVVAAYQVAVSARLEAYAQGLDDADRGPRPELRPAPRHGETVTAQLAELAAEGVIDDRPMRELGNLLHEANEQIETLVNGLHEARNRTVGGHSRSRQVAATVSVAGALEGLDMSEQWLSRTHPTNVGREITEAVAAAQASARLDDVRSLLSTGVLGELQQLAGDPVALARRLGMR